MPVACFARRVTLIALRVMLAVLALRGLLASRVRALLAALALLASV